MQKRSPRVSVVVPTYNRASLVGRAVRSVLAQTFQGFELIIVDDASKDGTDEVINNLEDPRIKYIRHDTNKGAPCARNTGIRTAAGKYLAFLDDDDEWHRDKLEKQLNRFQQVADNVGLIYSGLEVRDRDSDILKKIYRPMDRGNVRQRLLLGTTIGSPTPLIKRECFKKAGLFDESLKSCQDWDMWKRISEHYEFDFVPETLARVYLHSNRISTNLETVIAGRSRMILKHRKEFARHPEIYAVHLKRMGKLHSLDGNYREACTWFKKALKINYWELIKILSWVAVEFPKIKLTMKSNYH